MPVFFFHTGCHAKALTSLLLLVLETDESTPAPSKVPGCLSISSSACLTETGKSALNTFLLLPEFLLGMLLNELIISFRTVLSFYNVQSASYMNVRPGQSASRLKTSLCLSFLSEGLLVSETSMLVVYVCWQQMPAVLQLTEIRWEIIILTRPL